MHKNQLKREISFMLFVPEDDWLMVGYHKCTNPLKLKSWVRDECSVTWLDYFWNVSAENTNLRWSLTVRLTSCVVCLDSAALFLFNEQQFYLFGQIQTSKTEGQLYSDTSPMLSVLWSRWQIFLQKAAKYLISFCAIFKYTLFCVKTTFVHFL